MFTYPMIIELDGISIEITRKKIKNINLRVCPPHGLVKVSAPLRSSERLIRQTLEHKVTWIRQHQERMRHQLPPEALRLETGASIPFRGKNYLLILHEHDGPTQMKLHEELLHCYAPVESTQQQRQAILEHWYQREMRALLPDLIQHWQAIIGVKVLEWGIKRMKTRWGSCNIKTARISLNLSLIEKPPLCLEYVLVHELIHLLEPSHNQRFYTLMEQFMPQWREYEQLLKGRTL